MKYPLAVKLGTITPGGADVYSYEEDCMILDPNLATHLSHFGINMVVMSKVSGWGLVYATPFYRLTRL